MRTWLKRTMPLSFAFVPNCTQRTGQTEVTEKGCDTASATCLGSNVGEFDARQRLVRVVGAKGHQERVEAVILLADDQAAERHAVIGRLQEHRMKRKNTAHSTPCPSSLTKESTHESANAQTSCACAACLTGPPLGGLEGGAVHIELVRVGHVYKATTTAK